jgi:hypothetical protein
MPDDDRYTGLVSDPSQPSRELMPPLGMTLNDEQRQFVIETYGELALADWERRNAEFLAAQAAEEDATASSNLTDEETNELLRSLGLD